MGKKEEGREKYVFIEAKQEEVKWVKHYYSNHSILLVGEGDFSFSSSLALSFGSASNVVATSLDSYDAIITMYKNAKSNLEKLKNLGASILHGVDANTMKHNPDLKMRKFDRIIFNFPHAGFYGKEDNINMILMHKKLVLGFFKNASGMLRPYGEIHVSHKTKYPFSSWSIEELARKCSLSLKECANFDKKEYPGYENKRGQGNKCDESFHLGRCCTFKFELDLHLSNGARRQDYGMDLTETVCDEFRSLKNFSTFWFGF